MFLFQILHKIIRDVIFIFYFLFKPKSANIIKNIFLQKIILNVPISCISGLPNVLQYLYTFQKLQNLAIDFLTIKFKGYELPFNKLVFFTVYSPVKFHFFPLTA